MNVYCLTQSGRQKFEKMKDNSQLFNTVGYKILEYLFANGTGTSKEITDFTGVSHSEVIRLLNQFTRSGSVEVLERM
jgi:hypothetical protein